MSGEGIKKWGIILGLRMKQQYINLKFATDECIDSSSSSSSSFGTTLNGRADRERERERERESERERERERERVRVSDDTKDVCIM